MQIRKDLIFKCHHILRYKEGPELQHMNFRLLAFLAFYILIDFMVICRINV